VCVRRYFGAALRKFFDSIINVQGGIQALMYHPNVHGYATAGARSESGFMQLVQKNINFFNKDPTLVKQCGMKIRKHLFTLRKRKKNTHFIFLLCI
jgi:hypothetical protein